MTTHPPAIAITPFRRLPSLLLFIFCTVFIVPANAAEWRTPDPEQTVYLDTDDGRIVIELTLHFAPKTVERFKHLVRAGFYDGLSFYRVIEGFVAQGGDGSDLNRELTQPSLPPEFELVTDPSAGSKPPVPFVTAQRGDLFAAVTGFVDSFPAAHDASRQHYWLVHCPGAVAMARDNHPGSGSTDFYIVIGQAPRYLDRNLTLFGRVLHGMDIVQRIRRGPADSNGIIKDKSQQTRIRKVQIAADIPAAQRLPIQVTDTNSKAFKALLEERRHRTHEFFQHTPPAVLDVCQVPIATRMVP